MTAIAIQDPIDHTTTSGRPSRPSPTSVLSFPPFRLDLAEERLWKGERELRLRPKPFAILRFLAQNPRRLVTHSEIVDAVWGRIAMSESLLRTHMRDLRRVLGETVIETVVGRGYRFVANMTNVEGGATASVGPTALGVARRLAPMADRARVLKQLADAVEAMGTFATVVLIVGDARDVSLEP
jgi:DNA-binding winged helix-turn-helix (wHTH) protein